MLFRYPLISEDWTKQKSLMFPLLMMLPLWMTSLFWPQAKKKEIRRRKTVKTTPVKTKAQTTRAAKSPTRMTAKLKTALGGTELT
jgi:hypothetical protein